MRGLIIAVALLWSAGVAEAQYSTKVAVSGQKIRLDFVGSINPDCTSSGNPTIRIAHGPEHGRVTTHATRDFPNFAASNIRSVCNTRRVPGRIVYYVSQRGFTGTDAVTMEYFYPSGTMRRHHFTIQVR